MCEICNIEKGVREHLMNNLENFEVGDFGIEHGLSVDIEKDEHGYHSLRIDYIVGEESSKSISVDLDYCPFCGEELKHKPKHKLGK